MNDQAKAILAAGVLIAAAIYLRPNSPNAGYQMVAVNSGVPMRLNVATGQVDWCTRLDTCETLMPAGDFRPNSN